MHRAPWPVVKEAQAELVFARGPAAQRPSQHEPGVAGCRQEWCSRPRPERRGSGAPCARGGSKGSKSAAAKPQTVQPYGGACAKTGGRASRRASRFKAGSRRFRKKSDAVGASQPGNRFDSARQSTFALPARPCGRNVVTSCPITPRLAGSGARPAPKPKELELRVAGVRGGERDEETAPRD